MRRFRCANGKRHSLEISVSDSTRLEAISPATASHTSGRADFYLGDGDRGHPVSRDHRRDPHLAFSACARYAVRGFGPREERFCGSLRGATTAAICRIVDAMGTRS